MTAPPQYRFYWLIGSIFVAVLLIANTVGVKLFTVGPLVLPAGIIVFPISYIFGDVLTEVYGYGPSRKIIWTGLGCLALMSCTYYIVQLLPPPSFWPNQQAYESILGFAPRVAFASAVAYFAGEFSNSFVLAKMKIWTEGKHLWARTIGSTVVGEGVDTIVFVVIAFTGTQEANALAVIIGSNYLIKVLYEIVVTPITYLVVGKLKKAERVDVYDRDTNFNPFLLIR